jgi:adenylate kinase
MTAPVVLVLGPPGAGKGTQAAILAERLGAVHLSSGQMLRDSRDPAIVSLLARGELARTEDFLRVVGAALEAIPADRPVVLDGVGRMLPEAEWLLAQLERMGRSLPRVVYLDVGADDARQRALARGRADDDPEAQVLRWRRFQEETLPVVDLYRARGLLIEVDGGGTIDDVASRVKEALS